MAAHWHVAAPALLALSFHHCRNVTTLITAPDAKVNAARARRGRSPLHRYRTLVIEPMTRVLSVKGGVEVGGLARALHICRGHFKTFEERPLFGRLRGTWWWHDSVRGSAAAGSVTKTYDVRPGTTPERAIARARRRRGTVSAT